MSDTSTGDIPAGNANFGTQINYGSVTYIIQQAAPSGTTPPKPTTVFLSYARKDDGDDYDDADKSLMRRLSQQLTQHGFAVWWDRISLPSRTLTFSAEIEAAIRASDRFVLVVGEHTDTPWVRAEIQCAMDHCKPISAILRGGDYPLVNALVKDVNAIDFRAEKRPFDAALTDLVKRLAEPAPLGRLIGVKPLPRFYLERAGVFQQAHAALCKDAIAASAMVISAPASATAVYGTGGIGKSTLAAALAHDCIIRRSFPDGVVWVEVGQTPILPAIQATVGAVAFGDSRDNYQNEIDGKAALSLILRDKSALIVLDDVWDHRLIQHFPVAGTACRLLITTRSGELARRVEGDDIPLHLLSAEEGAALIAKRTGGDPNDPLYIEISRALGGHTLAIALAAARLDKKGAAYAPKLLDGLKNPRDPFANLNVDREDKDLNLSKSLDQSLDMLDDDLKRRWRALGVLALEATFDLSLLAALWGDDDPDEADRPLEDLLDASLLEKAEDSADDDEPRYQQHRLLRAYALALLHRANERDPIFNRYADFVTEQAGQFDTLPPEEWTQLDPLLPHVGEVGDELAKRWQAAPEPDDDLTRRANDFAYAVTRYVELRPQMIDTPAGRQHFGLRWLEMGLESSRKMGNQKRESLFCNQLGLLWDDLGEKGKALEYYEQSVTLKREIGDQRGEATTLNNIGLAYSDLGEKRKALEFYEQALPMHREVGNRAMEATTLNNIGSAYSDLGEKGKALAYYEQALPLYRAVGDRGGEATTLNNIGAVYRSQGEMQKALDYYEQALPLRRAVGDRGGEAATLNNIGLAYHALGEKKKALAYYGQALPLYRAVGDRGGEATTLNNIGLAYHALGEKGKALEYYEQALPLYRAVGDRGGEATTLNNIGLAYHALGEKGKALEYYEQALPLRRAVGDREGEANTLFNMSFLTDDLDRAIEMVQTAYDLLVAIVSPYAQSHAAPRLAELKAQRGG